MRMHPDLLKQLANDHQRQMLREAEGERLLMRARPERPRLAMRMRLHLSALLSSLARLAQPRDLAEEPDTSMTQSLAQQ